MPRGQRSRIAVTLACAALAVVGAYLGTDAVHTASYEQVRVRGLGETHALMTGRFILSGGGRPDSSGWFTLVWEWRDGGWKIVHDHSS